MLPYREKDSCVFRIFVLHLIKELNYKILNPKEAVRKAASLGFLILITKQ
jgi:hypothetical protein